MKKMIVAYRKTNGPAFDSILLAIIQVITYGTNIITTKILSMEFSLNEYGTYSTVNSVITIAASLTLFGLGDSINYFYNKKASDTDRENREEYVNTIFLIQLIIGVIVGVILVVCSDGISNYYSNPLVKTLILIVCLKPWISNATHLYQVLFVSSGKARLIAMRNFVISVSKIILIYMAIKFYDSLSVIFVCLVLLDVFQLIAFKYIFGKIRFKVNVFSFKKEKILPVIRYTVPMGVYFVTTTLMREIDKLVIGRLGTTEELAVYSNCARTLPLNILVISFATVLIPYIMKNVSSKNFQLTTQILKKYFTVGYLSVWMFSSALLLCAPEAIRFFYSNEYVIGVPVFVVYILDGMIQFASVHLVIAASGNSKYLMKTSMFLLILNLTLSVIMYKAFELISLDWLGPAFATIIVSMLYVYILFVKSAKILQVKISDFLPIKRMVIYLSELLIVCILFLSLKHGLKLLNIHWIIIFFLICGCYCATICLLHFNEYKKLFLEINKLKRSDI